MTLTAMRIIVVGAGIGGLAAALALARRGARVEVLEQADALRCEGAGIQISPNGTRVLQDLGLGERLAQSSLRAEAVEIRDGRRGGMLLRMALGAANPGYFLIKRGDLIAMLAETATQAGVSIRLGQRVDGLMHAADGPGVSIAGEPGRSGDLVIGAEGMNSVVRAALNGAARPRFTGQAAWRATVAAAAADAPVVQVFTGPGRHLVSYPLPGGLRNIVAVEERQEWVAEGWQHSDDPARMRAAFAGFGGPVPGWLNTVRETHLWGLFRHPVAAHWQADGAALLGDAAHPTLPFLAQGANMALEDALVLARCLATGATLAAYQNARLGRVTRIVAAAETNARAYHLRSASRAAAHLGLRTLGAVAPLLMLRRYDWLYRHDAAGTPL